MKLAKPLSLLLAIALVASLLAGCGSSSSSSSSTSTSSSSTTEETTAAAETEEATTEVAEEAEVSAEATSTTISYPLCEQGEITLTYWMQWPPFLNGSYDPGEVPFFSAMEEITGVHLEVIYCSTEEVDTQLALLAAADSFYDLMQGVSGAYTGGGTKAIEDEMLLDLLPYMEENMPNYWAYMQDDAVSKLIINDEGYVPSLYGIYSDYYYTDQGLWVRQDWLDELGIETPETLDEFTAMLQAFQTEKGVSDALVVLSTGNVEALLSTFGTNEGVYVLEGQVQYGPVADGTKEYYTYMNQLYNTNLISQDFISYTDSDTKPPENIVLNSMTGVFHEDVSSITSYTNVVEGMDLKALAAPVLNEGEKLSSSPYACLVSSQYEISVSCNCENVEIALQYIDYLFSEEGLILTNYGQEGNTYTIEDGVYTFTDEILNDPLGFQVSLLINICPGFVRMVDWDITYLTYNDRQKEAVDIWLSCYDSTDSTYPRDYVSYTAAESELIAELSTDISTYVEECRLKFITGAMDIETQWDEYVANIEAMKLDQLLEVYQAAYERYLAK